MPFISYINQQQTEGSTATLVQHITTTIKHPKPMLRNYDYVNLYHAKANCTQLQYALCISYGKHVKALFQCAFTGSVQVSPQSQARETYSSILQWNHKRLRGVKVGGGSAGLARCETRSEPENCNELWDPVSTQTAISRGRPDQVSPGSVPRTGSGLY